MKKCFYLFLYQFLFVLILISIICLAIFHHQNQVLPPSSLMSPPSLSTASIPGNKNKSIVFIISTKIHNLHVFFTFKIPDLPFSSLSSSTFHLASHSLILAIQHQQQIPKFWQHEQNSSTKSITIQNPIFWPKHKNKVQNKETDLEES